MLDVVIVCLELLLEIQSLIVETGECQTYAFELTLALHPSSMFGADVYRDGVEEVLIVVVAGDAASLFETEDVFESGALEFRVGHGGDVDDGVRVRVSTPFAATGRELLTNEVFPSVLVFHGDWFDHDFHQVGSRLNPNDEKDTTLSLRKEGFHLSLRIYMDELAWIIYHKESLNQYVPSRSCNFGLRVRQISDVLTLISSCSLLFALPSSRIISRNMSS